MSFLFEPTSAAEDGEDNCGEGEDNDWMVTSFPGDDGGEASDGSDGGGGTFRGFALLGTGRFSKVVRARRKSPWRGLKDGDGVCAIKVGRSVVSGRKVGVGGGEGMLDVSKLLDYFSTN